MVLRGDVETGNKGCEGLFSSHVRKYMCALAVVERTLVFLCYPRSGCAKKQVFPASMRINCEKETLKFWRVRFRIFAAVDFLGRRHD